MSRRSQINHFPQIADAPTPLMATIERRVRFEEVDMLGIVWHGRYPSYFEDGREALGEKFGLSYMDMRREEFIAPIVQMHIDYHRPLSFPEDFEIASTLHWTDGVRLNFSYQISSADGVIATGYTVQLILDMQRQVQLVRPPFLEDFWHRWQAGRLS